ncbi:transcriptional regulator family: Fungal Specific TF [Paecilomyces variotii]|nr:transcriptional regulator family: Fungal Specific TF [Paecilomyces variotii]
MGVKVAIPRISTSGPAMQRRRRAPRACEQCRQRKIKCTAETPSCRQCLDLNLHCAYSEGKRVREQRQLESLTRKVEQYERFMREISEEVDDHVARRIRRVLKSSEVLSSPKGGEESDPEDSDASSSSLGSLNAVDIVEEDLNRSANTRATGFMGKNSEVTWMKRLEAEADKHDNDPATGAQGHDLPKDQTRHVHQELPTSDERYSITNMNYHLDDLAIASNEDVDPYALPPKKAADKLFYTYLEYVYPSFPMIRKRTFICQYQHFFKHPESKPGAKWLAILNMIFAIGFRYFELSEGTLGGDTVYLQRARKLALSDNVLFTHADLQMVQVEALTALYLLASGQVNRAWNIAGLAIRSAIALGINLRNVDGKTTDESKQARRVSCISDSATSTDPPLPFEENSDQQQDARGIYKKLSYRECHPKGTLFEDRVEAASTADYLKTLIPNPSLYFFVLVDLTLVSHAVLNTVYTVNAVRDGWSQTVSRISRFSSKLEVWLSKVPDVYKFPLEGQDQRFEKEDWTKERFSLAINYYSAKITLTRPCLTHPESREPSPSSDRKNQHTKLGNDMAQVCLDSALSLIGLLPEEPDVAWLFRLSPWWCILHNIMQATVIILIHLSVDNMDDAPLLSTVLAAAKKAHRWLVHMANRSLSYQRAFALCDGFIRRTAPKRGFDISDLSSPASVEQPEPSAKRHRSHKPHSPSQRLNRPQSDIAIPAEDIFRPEWVDLPPSQQSPFHANRVPLVGFLSSDLDMPQWSFPIPEQASVSTSATAQGDEALMDIDSVSPDWFSYGLPQDATLLSSLVAPEPEEFEPPESLGKKRA